MGESTKEEMIWVITLAEENCIADFDEVGLVACKTLRCLIENQLGVTKQQIEDLALILLAARWPEQTVVIQQWLENKGMKIIEEKSEIKKD